MSKLILPLVLPSPLLRPFLPWSLARIVKLLLALSGSLPWPRSLLLLNTPVLGILFPCHLMLGLSPASIKIRSDGTIEHYKAYLVARGFQQEHGRDYDETFAPVAHMTTVRTLIAVAFVRQWSISQLDVKNAFLNGDLNEEVYMQSPPGYSAPPGHVCRLHRALYGLKQAPRAWFERFTSVITAAGFSVSAHDPTPFVHTSSRDRTLLLLYVDDMLITGDDSQHIAFVKKRLGEKFMMSDLGPLRYFLGIEVTNMSDGYYLSQQKYIQDIMDRSGFIDNRIAETPMELNLQLRATDGEPLEDSTRYRHLVGSLVYLGITRPDISHAVHILSQFVCSPT
uniref:Reverse transcriptase Ty1/copia-type domain-containing protein n=1 Tax=Arundo donax TaxID=35708 RepID=A0A0A9GAH2_ARUDO